jgi:hypothetical protein
MEQRQQKRQQFQSFTILVEHVLLRLKRDSAHPQRSTKIGSLRRTLSKPFKGQRQAPRHAAASKQIVEAKSMTNTDESQATITRGRYLETAPKLSREIMANNLHQVEDYVRRTSMRVQDLEALIKQGHSTIGRVTEIKRQLKTAHRNLEKLHFDRCPSLGFEVNQWVQVAMRLAWQAYRRIVKLEEKLKSLPVSLSDSEDWIGDYEKESPVMIGVEMKPDRRSLEADTSDGAAELSEVGSVRPITYVPTGAKAARLSIHIPRAITIIPKEKPGEHSGTYRISGALSLNESFPIAPSPTRASSLEKNSRKPPRLVTYDEGFESNGQYSKYDGGYDSEDSLYNTRLQRHRAEQKKERSVVEDLDPIYATIPRIKIEARMRAEEAELATVLIDPDRQRQGSCDGWTVTDMVMNNVLNEDYVLPYLHFIKHHELRALKQWLVARQYLKKSAVISRMEKVLHYFELLQTGCRYETIATVFSRTPRQVESSCHEVMEGLLEMHGFTMIKARDQEMYTTLWGIWCRKFASPQNQDASACYYGFDWIDFGKAMVTLNLYIGRWREQGKFALEGPSLNWGKFFGAEGTGKFPRMDQSLQLQYSAIGSNSSDETHDESEDDDDECSIFDGGAVQTA